MDDLTDPFDDLAAAVHADWKDWCAMPRSRLRDQVNTVLLVGFVAVFVAPVLLAVDAVESVRDRLHRKDH